MGCFPYKYGYFAAKVGQKEHMFLGRFEHVLDSKSRLTVPVKYRPVLSEGMVVTKGPGDFLVLFPAGEWERLVARSRDLPTLTDEDVAELRRWLFAEAAEVEMDSQGRIIIPSELRDHAGITNAVTLAGVDTHVELWTPAYWQNRTAHRMQDNELTASFRTLRL